MHSPDRFHQIRMYLAQLKAVNINLQQMEFRAHSGSVSEYQLDVLSHLLDQEARSLPNLRLIQQQPQINLNMRPLLLDFLLEVINKSKMSKATFPLAVNLIDRYCSTRIVKKHHFQLLGLTCLWVACKNLDSKFKIPTLEDLRRMCCNSYDKKLFLEMENHLLISLNWMINAPTYDTYIDLFLNLLLAGSKNACVNKSSSSSKYETFNRLLVSDVKVLSLFICELIQFYPNIYFSFTTVQIAICAVITSLLILDIPININSYLKFFNDVVRISKQDDGCECPLYVATNIETVNVYTEKGLNDVSCHLASPKSVTVPSSAFKSLAETKNFAARLPTEFPASNYSIDHNEVLSYVGFNLLYSNLVKILKGPPNSMRAKYFNEQGKFVRLMRAVIDFANMNKRLYNTAKNSSNDSFTGSAIAAPAVGVKASNIAKPRVRKISTVEPATPNTPKCNSNHYGLPPTPVSSNISPKDKDMEPLLPLQHQQQPNVRQVTSSEHNVQHTRKRTFEDAVAIANSSSTGVFNQQVTLTSRNISMSTADVISAIGAGNRLHAVTSDKTGTYDFSRDDPCGSFITIHEAEEDEYEGTKGRVYSSGSHQEAQQRGNYSSIGGDMKRCKSQPQLSNFL